MVSNSNSMTILDICSLMAPKVLLGFDTNLNFEEITIYDCLYILIIGMSLHPIHR